MKPIHQSGLTLLAVICALAIFFAARWLNMAGLFTAAAPNSANVCRTIANLPGAGDFQIDAAHNAILVAANDLRHPGSQGGVYQLTLDGSAAAPVRLPGAVGDFHPAAISLVHAPDGSSESLVVVNARSKGRPTVESFTLTYDGAGGAKLAPQTAVAGGLLVDPSDVTAAAADRFYVASAHGTSNGLGRFAEDDLLWAHADLLFFNGANLQISVERLAHASSVYVNANGSNLYIAAANERRLIAFSRENFTGNLSEIGSLSLPAVPDKITQDAQGNLIIAGHPDLLKDRAFAADASKPSPSEVFRVRLDGKGVPQGFETLYANDGHVIGAASMASVVGKRLLISSALDGKLVDCAIK